MKHALATSSLTRRSAEADPTLLPSVLKRAILLVGWKTWHDRYSALQMQTQRNPISRQFVLKKYGIEFTFVENCMRLRQIGKLRWPPQTAIEHRMFSFIIMLMRVYDSLGQSARNRLVGSLRSGLEKEFGLGPLAFEMRIVAHLLSQSFSINFHDLNDGGGFDFLASKNDVEVEVECKHISGDIGRQICPANLYSLAERMYPLLSRYSEESNRGRIIELHIPSRLSAKHNEQSALVDAVRHCVSSGDTFQESSLATVVCKDFALNGSPFDGHNTQEGLNEEIHRYLKEEFGVEHESALMCWSRRRGVAVLVIRSRKKDRVLRTILKKLKRDSKGQFSGLRPAILCAHLSELNETELSELEAAERKGILTGLRRMISELLDDRPQIHTVAMLTDGTVNVRQGVFSDFQRTEWQEAGPSYVFANHFHPLASDPVLSEFFRPRV